jgi:hypothetical protein
MSESAENLRIAIVNEDKVRCRGALEPIDLHLLTSLPLPFLPLLPLRAPQCKPKKCKQECYKSCPVVRMGT